MRRSRRSAMSSGRGCRPTDLRRRWNRARCCGVPRGTHDLILVDSGEAEVVRAATARAAEAVVAGFGAGQFAGQLSLLTGQATYLSARVSKPGQVHRISPVCFRQLMDEDPDLSDVILRPLMARRRYLRGGEAARSIEILGSEMSAGALALRTYAARQQLPHAWVEIDTPAGAALARAVTAAGGDLPVVITPTAVLRHATPALLAGHLGLSYQPVAGPLLDLVIVGAGPAGLAAAVYGASEGLRTCCCMPSLVAGRLRPARGSRTTSGSPPASAAPS